MSWCQLREKYLHSGLVWSVSRHTKTHLHTKIHVDTKTNLSLWTTKRDHCVESVCIRSFFLVRLFPHLGWVWRFAEQVPVVTQNVTRHGPDQPRMQILFTQLTSEHCFVILIPLYCKLAVISWLNDCEDIKVLVPTHVVLFH